MSCGRSPSATGIMAHMVAVIIAPGIFSTIPSRLPYLADTNRGDCMKVGHSAVWAATLVFALAAPGVCAQAFPSKPVRIIVGFTPGGGVDINARLLAPELTKIFGQQVIVENRPGAGTNIANELVARAAPDGYTVLINTAALVINMSLY